MWITTFYHANSSAMPCHRQHLHLVHHPLRQWTTAISANCRVHPLIDMQQSLWTVGARSDLGFKAFLVRYPASVSITRSRLHRVPVQTHGWKKLKQLAKVSPGAPIELSTKKCCGPPPSKKRLLGGVTDSCFEPRVGPTPAALWQRFAEVPLLLKWSSSVKMQLYIAAARSAVLRLPLLREFGFLGGHVWHWAINSILHHKNADFLTSRFVRRLDGRFGMGCVLRVRTAVRSAELNLYEINLKQRAGWLLEAALENLF